MTAIILIPGDKITFKSPDLSDILYHAHRLLTSFLTGVDLVGYGYHYPLMQISLG